MSVRLFPLTNALGSAGQSFPERYDRLRTTLQESYRAYQVRPNTRLDIESALFILWSMEIGLLNSRGWWLDQRRAQARFSATMRHGTQHPATAEAEAGRGLERLYRDRYRDVLRTIRNIYVRWDDSGCLQVPLTPRATKLFLSYTVKAGDSVPLDLQPVLHELLMEECRSHILSIMAAVKG